jgi:hypothetical protein
MPIQEFKAVLGLSSKFSDREWEQIIKSIDLNGDGQVNIKSNSDRSRRVYRNDVEIY